MIRANLLAWQWSDYVAKHRDRGNLLIHIVAVPLFQLATLLLIGALVGRSITTAVIAVVGMVVALVLQGRGHRREAEMPAPFDGAGDFVSRFVVEQWVTFPRFVLSGAWADNLRRARA
jgi:phage terminase small subunit